MSCAGCSTGRGSNNTPGGCQSNGNCGTGGCNQMNVFDWLSDMVPNKADKTSKVEVRFKNGRKAYFSNTEGEFLKTGDVVAVESSPGHDIGTVSLTGELVELQIGKKKIKEEEIYKIYRQAKESDIDKWQDAIKLEKPTLTKARVLAIDLGLQMKICDVEYQGDKTKAVFYYTAESRVDFRELIRHYADAFRVRIEMKQIGARQEAAKLGGVGSCGRELCCSSWLSDFRTVSTGAARYQQLSLNPEKLAGQCGKLKCCLNYELDSYLDALKEFPSTKIMLHTEQASYSHFKSDIFSQTMWYSCRGELSEIVAVPLDRVKEVMALNKEDSKPDFLYKEQIVIKNEPTYENVVGQDELTRFDNKKKNKKQGKKKFFNKKKRPQKNNESK
ncbi:MAG: cell fate regulator YaaT (PSP1 superfamily) [Glaciecola sp.]|jgi:cell fate regulator YaaT (PSP1 superfamily)